MADFEFAIAVKDEPELATGHKRKKQGDIIAVKPAPWTWGRKEVDEYLIVPVIGLTKEEAHGLCQPMYEGGILQENITEETSPAVIAKRRYAIPLNIIKAGWKTDMDLTKVEGKKYVYQPLKQENLTDAAVTIDFSEAVDICLDRYKGTYKYGKAKTLETV